MFVFNLHLNTHAFWYKIYLYNIYKNSYYVKFSSIKLRNKCTSINNKIMNDYSKYAIFKYIKYLLLKKKWIYYEKKKKMFTYEQE